MPPKPCVFCSIIRGESPAHRVLDLPEVVAFLDARPLFPGHVLVVPKTHHETLGDTPPALVTPIFAAVQEVARGVEKGLAAEGSFVAVNNRISQSVPHLHVHVVPRRKGDGLKGFFWPRHAYSSQEDMAAIAARIAEAIETIKASGVVRS
jgi:histidine triad (HIT) family protein